MLSLSLLLLLSLLPIGMCNDFDVFCELVSLNSQVSLCSNCSDPCGNNCGVSCNGDNTRIMRIYAGGKGLTTLPESIGSLTLLTYL